MGIIQNLLVNSGVGRHNGQPLWRYNLSDADFNSLRKILITSKRLNEIDPRDCTLYYAEWWKRCYDGGFPSKKDIFHSFANGQLYNEDAFYQYAKHGADLLRIKWIKNQNTLYFKTLLLQGGLPVNHISNNKSAYKQVLSKIMELNPSSIDDFAFNPHITSLLPQSSRNDEIYACCLDLVKAIIDDDQAFLDFFNNNDSLNEISSELRVKRQRISNEKRLPTFRSSWVFEPSKSRIRLYLGIPDLADDDFRELFGIDEELLDFEYRLYYNDTLLCKLIKKADNGFRTKWIDNDDLCWDGSDQIPDFYLILSNGQKLKCRHLINYLPDLEKPGLWTSYSPQQWVLEKGAHSAAKEGFLLYPAAFKATGIEKLNDINLYGKDLVWAKFENSADVQTNASTYYFKTSNRKIDWIIYDHQPAWLKRANLPVVCRKPRIFVFDETGTAISQTHLKWRLRGNATWNDWNAPLANGLIELQIQAAGITEYDLFFNLGTLQFSLASASLNEAIVNITGNDFLLNVLESSFIEVSLIGPNKFSLSLKNNTNIPLSITVSIREKNQQSGLRFELTPPFKGVEIISSTGEIIANSSKLSLYGLRGFRLMSNQENLQVNIVNSRRPGMIISEQLSLGIIPLRNFVDKINQLYALSDTMDGEAFIAFEIFEQRGHQLIKIREYQILRYDRRIQAEHFDEGLQLCLSHGDTELMAIPLDCTLRSLEIRPLLSHGGYSEFSKDEQLEKFILFAKTNQLRVQPEFVCLDPYNIPTNEEDRKLRVVNMKKELLATAYEGDIWQQFLIYYNTCCDHHLPFSTFDILRSIGFSSLLAAKAFVFLTSYDANDVFKEETCEQMEQDLGFSFHWVTREHWVEAIDWMCGDLAIELLSDASAAVKMFLENQQPAQQFHKLTAFILQDKIPTISSGFHFNSRITDLRSSLGSRVLNELPQTFPIIPERYQDIIPVTNESRKVEILLRAPLVVALSIAGVDHALWHQDNEHKRRNIRYSQQLVPEWYAEAINYALTKI